LSPPTVPPSSVHVEVVPGIGKDEAADDEDAADVGCGESDVPHPAPPTITAALAKAANAFRASVMAARGREPSR
jgi:hypothetical protein